MQRQWRAVVHQGRQGASRHACPFQQSDIFTDQSTADWLQAARDGSREAMGNLLEACRAYLLLVANRELAADLRAKGGASDLVQDTFLEGHRNFSAALREIPRPSFWPGCGASC